MEDNNFFIKHNISKTERMKEECYEYCCDNCGNEFNLKYYRDDILCEICNENITGIEHVENKYDQKYRFCPVCEGYTIEVSDYLSGLLSGRLLFFANLITHYRHCHIASWDSMRESAGYLKASHYNYKPVRKKANNQIKRAVLKKYHLWFKEKGFTKEDFRLQNNDEETNEIIEKLFEF